MSRSPVHSYMKRFLALYQAGDSMIGTDTVVGEMSSLKRSVVGRQCVIGDKVEESR